MNCNEFWNRYNTDGLSPELREHLKQCAHCENEFLIERELDSTVSRLPIYQAPGHVWERIAREIGEEERVLPVRVPFPERFRRFIKGVFPVSASLRPAAVWLVIAVITASTGTYFATRALFPYDEDARMLLAANNLDDAERDYLTAIETFSRHVDEQKNNIDPELYDLYMEKLAILDEYIERCRAAVDENEYNTNARMYLALAYKEKTETLKEMAGKL